MKKTLIIFASALLFAGSAFAEEAASKPQLKWYGFVRNYFAFDTHESSAGTQDLYYYMPKDNDNNQCSFNFVSLTSRLGLDVLGYEVSGYKIGAKIETDFYLMSGTTAALRLRQAYVTVVKDGRNWKIGQAWHPMAADLPDIFSLESGAPFGPFSRTPQVNFEYNFDSGRSITAAALWQMQYTSTGPNGASAEYLKKGIIPELYLGFNFKNGSSILRVGGDLLSIKPEGDKRLTTFSIFEYGQKMFGDWMVKEKITYALDGSHMNLVGGYGKTDDGKYVATNALSGWATVAYKKSKTWVPSMLVGYIQNFGTNADVAGCWFKNSASTVKNMFRVQPEIVYNLGKLQFGLEYMLTVVNFGTTNGRMIAGSDFHNVANNRIQGLVKFTF